METTYEIHKWSYHRNGVAGQPFYLVDFTLTEEGESHKLLAVVPSDLRYEEQKPDEEYMTCVLNPLDIEDKWRGDRIHHGLIEAGLWDRITFDEVLADLFRRNEITQEKGN